MKNICFYFQVHQPFRLRTYRFFDIANDNYYYDDFSNRTILQKIANNCYLPMNELMLKLIKKFNGKFRICYSISGSAIEQFEAYAPEVINSFKKLAKTGCVEFLAETYSHSLVSLKDAGEFKKQVDLHANKIYELFGQKPEVFRNTELVYSDWVGENVHKMGYKAILTEGARHILGWKSPNFLYCNANTPKLKVLLRNYKLSDDIAFRFCNHSWSEWPLTADKFTGWLNRIEDNEEVINLFMDYETFGEHQKEDSGIFNFMEALPEAIINSGNFEFCTPTEVAKKLQPVSVLSVPHPISWADEERDLTAWLGNNLQREAFENLYSLIDEVNNIEDPALINDWNKLQTSDHFYYMCTKYFSDGAVHMYFNPYNSPYEAFINYMNVLSDFTERVKQAPKLDTYKNYSPELIDAEIAKMEEELKILKAKQKKTSTSENKTQKNVQSAQVKISTAKKTTKKTTTPKKKTSK